MASGESDLVATMEGLFASSEARVITAYKVPTWGLHIAVFDSSSDWDSAVTMTIQVIKCNPSTTSAWTKKKQPKVCSDICSSLMTVDRIILYQGLPVQFQKG